jgi:spore coat polysaccharide biosynthesis predicted glycosyltransferase SpsG
MERWVIFGTTGGSQAGLGHVRRCLTLAGALAGRGFASEFVVEGEPAVAAWVADAGYPSYIVAPGHPLAPAVARALRERSACAAVVDSYDVPTAGFRALLATGATIVAVDDLADRELPVHVVVNGGVDAERLDYRGLAETRYLLGTDYVLLRPEFGTDAGRVTGPVVERVLVAIGGGDPWRLLPRLVAWTRSALPAVEIAVLASPLSDAGGLASDGNHPGPGRVVVHRDPPDVRGLMLGADLALCAGGQTTYELAATGTPALAIQVAANQAGNLRGLAGAGALVCLGAADDAGLEDRVKAALGALAGDPIERARMSQAGRALVDGRGAERVADALVALAGEREACRR